MEFRIGADDDVLGMLEEGGYFGEMSLMTGQIRVATAVTVTDCEFVVVDKAAFQSLIESKDDLVGAICVQLEARRDALEEKQKEIAAAVRRAPGADAPSTLVSRIRRFFHTS